MIIIRPYKASSGALAVKERLNLAGHKAVVSFKDSFRPRHRVIRWGRPSNKLADFQAMSERGVRTPLFSTSPPVRTGNDKSIWLARTSLSGCGGAGIVVVRKGEPFPTAPLYTKYIKKVKEYRVHVYNGQAIYVQEKKKRNGVAMTDNAKLLRNYDNGWVFCNVPEDLDLTDAKQQAVNAVSSVGLPFGAVDLVIGKEDNLAYVLEVNSMPGLESPSVIAAYAGAIVNE